MVRRIGFVAAWVTATFATGLLAWGAVRVAGSQVTDAAVRPLSAAEVEALPTRPAGTASIPVETAPAGTVTTGPADDPVAAAGDDVIGPRVAPPASVPATPPAAPATTQPSPTTTAAPSTSGTTPSTVTTTTVTSTTVPPAPEVRTYATGGGSVTIVVSPGVVELGGASPAAGFTLDLEKDGPKEVKVRFEAASGEDHEFSAEWEGGELVVEID